MQGLTDIYIEHFKLYFPSAAKQLLYYEPIGYDCLEIKLDSGDVLIYDDSDKSIRRLPSNSNELTEDQFRNEFGKRLRRIMEYKRITQMDLCEKTGIPQCRISGYINGRHTPSFYIMDKIAKALRCSVEDFIYK